MATKPASQGAALTAALDEISYEFWRPTTRRWSLPSTRNCATGCIPKGSAFAGTSARSGRVLLSV